jgi:DNA-binding transcriptional LysR family regulator
MLSVPEDGVFGIARMAALGGAGVSFFMEADVRDDVDAGRLVQVLEDWTPPIAPLCLYYPSSPTRPPPSAPSSNWRGKSRHEGQP